jgi:hypothetical protein
MVSSLAIDGARTGGPALDPDPETGPSNANDDEHQQDQAGQHRHHRPRRGGP